MKKTIFAIALSLSSVVAVSAQEESAGEALVGRKGTPILPKAGDIAIGVEATPYLNYFGNMFNNSTSNSLNLGVTTLYGRYYLSDDAAVRVTLGINNNSNSYENFVTNDAGVFANPLSNAQTIDKINVTSNFYQVAAGYQMFRGYGRLRGFYGAELAFNYGSGTDVEYTYGNPISNANQAPTSTSWNVWGSGASVVSTGALSPRVLEQKAGSTVGFGINLLAGVEYYFAPKICIGGEVGLGYTYSSTSQSSNTQERWNGSSVVEEVPLLTNAGRSTSRLATVRPSTFGSLYLMFHF